MECTDPSFGTILAGDAIARLEVPPTGPARTSASLRWSRSEKAFVLLASVLFLALSIGSIRMESLTTNELLFIPAGLSYLQRHDARMDIEEPPLVKVIVAIPALLLHPKIDYNDPTWTANPGAYEPEYLFGQKFFEKWNPHTESLLFLTRLPAVGLTLLLGLSVYAMARRLAGRWGATLAMGVFATSPFFISYGSLVHMDIPIALFSLWAMWYFASTWHEPTMRNALLFSASLAGALLTKFSGVFLFPAILLAWVWFRYLERRSPNQGRPAPAVQKGFHRERLTLKATVLAGIVVYLFYLGVFYRSAPRIILQNEWSSLVSEGTRALPIDILVRRMSNHPGLERFLLPPALYAGGLAYVVGHERRPVYFFGHWHPQGIWFYFPVISFFKLASGMVLLFFLLAILTTVNFLSKRGKNIPIVPDPERFHVRAVAAGLVVFAAIGMSSKLNVGVRHFSVPITFAVLLSSLVIPLARSVVARSWRFFILSTTAALAFSCLVTALVTYPHYLSYYSVFRLNMPKQEIAVSSNLSWGQSMVELATFFREHHVATPYVDSGMSPIDPSVYVSGARDWQCDNPDPVAPEWVAVSTAKLVREQPNCDRLLQYPAWNIGDGSVMVFHMSDSTTSAVSNLE